MSRLISTPESRRIQLFHSTRRKTEARRKAIFLEPCFHHMHPCMGDQARSSFLGKSCLAKGESKKRVIVPASRAWMQNTTSRKLFHANIIITKTVSNISFSGSRSTARMKLYATLFTTIAVCTIGKAFELDFCIGPQCTDGELGSATIEPSEADPNPCQTY